MPQKIKTNGERRIFDIVSNSALGTSYASYFNSLKIPLKETSKIFVSIFSAIALSFQNTYFYAEEVLKTYFIQSEQNIEEYAKDRGISRIRNESSRSFQNRVLGAYSFMKNSSSKIGIENILKSFTEKSFMIRELYQENFVLGNKEEKLGETTLLQSSLASYYFVVEFDNPLTVEEKRYLTEIIESYKPAHMGFHLNARIVDDWKLGNVEEKLGINTYLEK